jgi:hypothetical protein
VLSLCVFFSGRSPDYTKRTVEGTTGRYTEVDVESEMISRRSSKYMTTLHVTNADLEDADLGSIELNSAEDKMLQKMNAVT